MFYASVSIDNKESYGRYQRYAVVEADVPNLISCMTGYPRPWNRHQAAAWSEGDVASSDDMLLVDEDRLDDRGVKGVRYQADDQTGRFDVKRLTPP